MILVTGATGQVGSEAVNALVAAGAEVRALVRRPSGFAAPEGVQVVQGNFDDDRSLARALEGVDSLHDLTIARMPDRRSPVGAEE